MGEKGRQRKNRKGVEIKRKRGVMGKDRDRKGEISK